METKYEFYPSGNMFISAEVDKQVCYSALHRGSAGVYGVFELGRSYVAKVVEGKPELGGLSSQEKILIKVVSRDLTLEENKYYIFCLIKIELDPLRVSNKLKFRAIEEFDISVLT